MAFAALGLTRMLNVGGAVLECSLRRGSQNGGSRENGRKASRGVTGEHCTFIAGPLMLHQRKALDGFKNEAAIGQPCLPPPGQCPSSVNALPVSSTK